MGGSSGGGGQSTVTTQVEKLPQELVPFYQDLLGRGVYESLTGYETYPDRRLADFDPYEAGAQEAYAEMALEGTPQGFADAQTGMREIAMGSPYERAVAGDSQAQGLAQLFQNATTTPDFYGSREPAAGQGVPSLASRRAAFREQQPTPLRAAGMTQEEMDEVDAFNARMDADPDFAASQGFGSEAEIKALTDDLDATSNFSSLEEQQADPRVQRIQELQSQQMSERPQASSEMERYMNPFQQTFIDRQKRMAREEAQRQQRNLGLEAAQAGSLGGGFEAVTRSEQQRNLSNQLQDIQAAGDMANFEQARRAYESDRQNRMDVADLGLRGFEGIGRDVDRRGAAAQSMANLSGQRQAMEIDRLGNLESAGQRRRGLAQQGLDIGYKDFQRQQAFPREQLNLYSSLLRGVPVGPGQYTSTYGDQPSAFQQLVGSGLGAAGLYGATQGSSGGWGSGWGGS